MRMSKALKEVKLKKEKNVKNVKDVSVVKTEKHAGGRPTIFSQELADMICEKIASHSLGLKRLCTMYPEMPDKHTINAWRYKYTEFSIQYAKAKIIQADLGAEEIMEIADDATNDWMDTIPKEDQPLGWKLNGEHVQRSKLRIDTRKWLAAKLAPKIYGIPVMDKNDKTSIIEEMLLKTD